MPQLTIDLTELGLPVSDAGGWVQAVDAFGNAIPIVASAGTLVFGARALEFSTGGAATIDLPSTDALQPDGVRYLVFLTRADTDTPAVTVGPFRFTTTADLGDVAELPPADYAQALSDATSAAQDVVDALQPIEGLAGRIDGYIDHGDVSGSLEVNPAVAWHVLDAVGPVAISFGAAIDGATLVVSVRSGLPDVTVVDALIEGDLPSDDAARLFIARERGDWVVMSGSTSDATGGTITPTAPTFTDQPGSGNDTVTIPSKTGVIYRIAGDTVTAGAHTLADLGLTPGVTVTVTAIAADGYTLTGTSEWSFTFTTAVGWTELATDTFTAANGTPLKNRVTTTGALTWTDRDSSNPNVTIQGNRASFTGSSYGNVFRIPLGSTFTEGVRVTFDYEMFGVNPNVGSMQILAAGQWTPHSGGIVIDQNGAIGLVGSVPPTNLTGTTTGHPTTGQVQVEFTTDGLKVRINGTQVATATLGSPLRGDAIDIGFSSNAAAIDNLLVEVYQ